MLSKLEDHWTVADRHLWACSSFLPRDHRKHCTVAWHCQELSQQDLAYHSREACIHRLVRLLSPSWRQAYPSSGSHTAWVYPTRHRWVNPSLPSRGSISGSSWRAPRVACIYIRSRIRPQCAQWNWSSQARYWLSMLISSGVRSHVWSWCHWDWWGVT